MISKIIFSQKSNNKLTFSYTKILDHTICINTINKDHNMKNINSFNSEQNLVVDDINYKYFDLKTVTDQFNLDIQKIPISIKIILISKLNI